MKRCVTTAIPEFWCLQNLHSIVWLDLRHFISIFSLSMFRRQTILAKLNTQDSSELQYMPGDHAGIFPANPAELVEAILSRLHNAPPPDQVLKTEILTETSTPLGQY
jgi:hypothetical protein